jgi:hypothetical protein
MEGSSQLALADEVMVTGLEEFYSHDQHFERGHAKRVPHSISKF